METGDRFVGRGEQLRLLDDVLSGERPERFVYVHGPGGIGKTWLLRRWAKNVEERGRRVAWIDGQVVKPNSRSMLEALGSELECDLQTVESMAEELVALGDLTLCIDGFEHLRDLEAWFRERLFPDLPADTLVLFAGRPPLSEEWVVDPGWRAMLCQLQLPGLDVDAARSYLEGRAVRDELVNAIVSSAGGLPLALAAAADAVADTESRSNGVVAAALGTTADAMIGAAPTARHRQALQATVLVPSMTEDLLRAMMAEEDVAELFAWLGGLSAVDVTPRGLVPHELLRETMGPRTVEQERETYRAFVTRARDYYADGSAEGRLAPKLAIDGLMWLAAHYLGAEGRTPTLAGFSTPWRPRCERAADIDPRVWAEIEAITQRHEGDAAVAWLRHHKSYSNVFADIAGGNVSGFSINIVPTDNSAAARDPAVMVLLNALTHRGVECPRISAIRFWMTSDGFQEPSSAQARVLTSFCEQSLTAGDVTVVANFLAAPHRWWLLEGPWTFDPRAETAIGGRTYGWAYSVPRDGPLGLALRATAQPLGWRSDVASPPPASFRHHVVEALGRIAGERQQWESVLLDLALMQVPRGASRAERAAELERLLRDQCQMFAESPKDETIHRVIEATFLCEPGTQAEIATRLGLPLGSYRRYLDQGITRIVQALWQRELAAGPTHP